MHKDKMMLQKNATPSVANTARAMIIAAAALLNPDQAGANIPDMARIPTTATPEQGGSVSAELPNRLYFGDRDVIEDGYLQYSNWQVRRIVTTFLNTLADKYDRQAEIPIIPITIDSCVTPQGSTTLEIRPQPELRQTAGFFRNVAQSISNPDMNPDVARGFAITVLQTLGPFLPSEVVNPDETATSNPLATQPNGILLKIMDRKSMTGLAPEEGFIGKIEGKDTAVPQATLLREPDSFNIRGQVITLERIFDMGTLLTFHIREQNEFPYLLLMKKSGNDGHEGLFVKSRPDMPGTTQNCMMQLRP